MAALCFSHLRRRYMSVYFNKQRDWWEYYFRHKKRPYTAAGFKKKKEAQTAEAERKKEVRQPAKREETDMAFLTLLNSRLDYIQAYRSKRHYQDNLYLARRWLKQWKDKTVHQITPQVISKHLIAIKNSISAQTASKELRALRAVWNYGIKPPNRWFIVNPTDGLEFFPTESKVKYVPPIKDVKIGRAHV